ncbi:3-beta hydroxysteroid dehydrogenase isomerase family [Moniliophthora roreri MCA 2997]|uniref:3-beta hydroxysteroid dehydrogenase isomerase family n=1 Tax=Moniliophthora roreri (strain MCA 2997) TaxID=1381753 RepID=V2XRH4_MONRO|nr:3-beta hydroxysteroid dehydrogenase isomerase family [Moniliophthora roreri MCA 2997]
MAFNFSTAFAPSLSTALQPLARPGVILTLGIVLTLAIYINLNDRAIVQIPQEALAFIQERWTKDDLERVVKHLEGSGTNSLAEKKRAQMPPKTGRRYIITGGSGFLGGWMVIQLLERGEDPKNIRILDVRPPNRRDFMSGLAKDVPFIKVDITSKEDVEAAFSAPWPSANEDTEVTVFHTAAVIRFHERHPSLLPLSEKVNIHGSQNVIDAAKKIGATVLISTSSASIAHWYPGRQFSLPWEWPRIFGWFGLERRVPGLRHVMILGDQEGGDPGEKERGRLPHDVEEFVCVYSYTKAVAEKLVRAADKTTIGSGSKLLRTGTLRPGNPIYGPGCDMYEFFLANGKDNVSFSNHSVTNLCYVENIALAHLLYERRLIDLADGKASPDVGGQAFTITDPGPPATSGDIHDAIAFFMPRFTGGKAHYGVKKVSPTFLLLLAHIIEKWYLTRQWYGASIPPVPGQLVPLQPSTLGLATVHPIVDDSRARLSVEQGGLGYEGIVETLEGVARCVKEFNESGSLRLTTTKSFGHGK